MGWAIGYDSDWGRDVGYGVPAHCDHPGCTAKIDRGLSHVCGGEPGGGENGCGLHFCDEHLVFHPQVCLQCYHGKPPFTPKPDHPEWVQWKLTDDSWRRWRDENPQLVAKMRAGLGPQFIVPPKQALVDIRKRRAQPLAGSARRRRHLMNRQRYSGHLWVVPSGVMYVTVTVVGGGGGGGGGSKGAASGN